MKKILILIFLALVFPLSVLAQYESPKETYNISVDKLVGYPVSDGKGGVDYQYVDNVSINDYVFGPQNYLFFKVKIKNNSNVDLNNVVIYDYLPGYSELFNDPGTYDSSTKTLTINVGTLKVNEEKEYLIKGRVLSADKLPADNKITCPVNTVRVDNGTVGDEDTASYCIQVKVKGVTTATTVTTVPKTGPEFGLLFAGFSGFAAFIGNKIRKIK